MGEKLHFSDFGPFISCIYEFNLLKTFLIIYRHGFCSMLLIDWALNWHMTIFPNQYKQYGEYTKCASGQTLE